eukprot:746828-Hanusia_phi.AAC.7
MGGGRIPGGKIIPLPLPVCPRPASPIINCMRLGMEDCERSFGPFRRFPPGFMTSTDLAALTDKRIMSWKAK